MDKELIYKDESPPSSAGIARAALLEWERIMNIPLSVTRAADSFVP